MLKSIQKYKDYFDKDNFTDGLRLLANACPIESRYVCAMFWFVKEEDLNKYPHIAIEYDSYQVTNGRDYRLDFSLIDYTEFGRFDYYIREYQAGQPKSNKLTLLNGKMVYYCESENSQRFFNVYWSYVCEKMYSYMYNIDKYRLLDPDTKRLISTVREYQGEFNKAFEEYI